MYFREEHTHTHTALLKFFSIPLLPIPALSEVTDFPGFLALLNELLKLQGQQSRAGRYRLALLEGHQSA